MTAHSLAQLRISPGSQSRPVAFGPWPQRFYIETLGCPKNQVDSDKIVGTLLADGHAADGLGRRRRPRRGQHLRVHRGGAARVGRHDPDAVGRAQGRCPHRRHRLPGRAVRRPSSPTRSPRSTRSAGFGVPVTLTVKPGPSRAVARPAQPASPARFRAVGVREDRGGLRPDVWLLRDPVVPRTPAQPHPGLDPRRGRPARRPGDRPRRAGPGVVREGRRRTWAPAPSCPSSRRSRRQVPRVRLLYLYPSDLTDGLIDVICGGTVPYFDLSLQHVSKPLLRRMRRWGDGERFLRRIDDIRERRPDAAFRTNFIVGYPGETEADHDQLLAFVDEAQLDWCGFFAYSKEEGTYAADLDGVVAAPLIAERLAELRERQDDDHGASPRSADRLEQIEVLVDAAGRRRAATARHPRSTASSRCPTPLAVGSFASVVVTGAMGPDLVAAVGLMATSFGPSALATPANGVTVARLLTAPLLFVDDRGHGRIVGRVPRVVRALRHRRHRRHPRSPSRHDAVRRVPRPARRQGARARGDVRARARGRVLVAARRADRRARDRDQHVPQHGRAGRGSRSRRAEERR